MKKILILIALTVAFSTQAQVELKKGFNTLTSTFSVAGLGGTDTSFTFTVPKDVGSFSVQAVLTDTVETGQAGVLLKGSTDQINYAILQDTVFFPITTYPKTLLIAEKTTFPYAIGAITVLKGSATDGDMKIFIYIDK